MTTAMELRVIRTNEFGPLALMAAEYTRMGRKVIVEVGSPKGAARCRTVAKEIMGEAAAELLHIPKGKPPIVANVSRRRAVEAVSWRAVDGKIK